jgi:hypothetical protein
MKDSDLEIYLVPRYGFIVINPSEKPEESGEPRVDIEVPVTEHFDGVSVGIAHIEDDGNKKVVGPPYLDQEFKFLNITTGSIERGIMKKEYIEAGAVTEIFGNPKFRPWEVVGVSYHRDKREIVEPNISDNNLLRLARINHMIQYQDGEILYWVYCKSIENDMLGGGYGDSKHIDVPEDKLIKIGDQISYKDLWTPRDQKHDIHIQKLLKESKRMA